MKIFAESKRRGRAALIAYLMAGDPTLEDTPALVEAAAAGGADLIELGFPYSDPLADGPTIQAAAQRALAGGATFERVLKAAARAAKRSAAPLLAFTYYNLLFARGLKRAATELRQAGFVGAVVPDLPPEEAQEMLREFARNGLGTVFLVAPTTPVDRARHVARLCTDFVYVTSRMGVTGADRGIGDSVRELVQRLRPVTDKPLAVGFGVSSVHDAATIARIADGVIIGSSLIERMAAKHTEHAAVVAVRRYCEELAAVM